MHACGVAVAVGVACPKAPEAKKTRDPNRTSAQPEVLTLPIAILRYRFISSRVYLVNRPIVRGSARNRGSVKVPVGGYEETRIGALPIAAAGKAVQDG